MNAFVIRLGDLGGMWSIDYIHFGFSHHATTQQTRYLVIAFVEIDPQFWLLRHAQVAAWGPRLLLRNQFQKSRLGLSHNLPALRRFSVDPLTGDSPAVRSLPLWRRFADELPQTTCDTRRNLPDEGAPQARRYWNRRTPEHAEWQS